jgi:hypothetical protein
LKKKRSNIFYSWLLLICFIGGQYTVYAHQHKVSAGVTHLTHSSPKSQHQQTIQEKCPLCDAMHHTNVILNQQVFFNPNIVTNYFFCVYNYDFVGIALIISAGRAPPMAAFC